MIYFYTMKPLKYIHRISLSKRLHVLLLLLSATFSLAQHGIGTNRPNPDAALHVEGINQGVLFPQVGLTSSTLLFPGVTATASHTGMLVYNTNTATDTGLIGTGYYVWSEEQWTRIDAPQLLSYGSTATPTTASQTFLTISDGNALSLQASSGLFFTQTASDSLTLGFVSGTATGTTLIWDAENQEWVENVRVHYRSRALMSPLCSLVLLLR